jgi:hypothetical protein
MLWFWVALILHIGVGFPYLFSGLLAPYWAVAILWLVWVILLVTLVRSRPEGPKGLWVPVLAGAIWLAAMFLGDRILDWAA